MNQNIPVACSLPWYSFEDHGPRGYRQCAHFRDTFHSYDSDFNLRWRSRDLGEIRYAMLVGRTPAGCADCGEATREMKRLGVPAHINPVTVPGLVSPRALSIRLGDGAPAMIPEPWLPELTHLTFFGAEPFSQPDFISTISRFVDSGDAAHVSLSLTTELSADPGEILLALAQFGNLTVQANVIDLGNRLDFISAEPSANIRERLIRLRDYTTPGSVSIVLRVTALNVLSLPELLELIHRDHPLSPIHLDPDSAAPEFHISQLPPKAKSEAGHRLKFIDPDKFGLSASHGIRPVIAALGGGADPTLFRSSVDRLIKDSGKDIDTFRVMYPDLSRFLENQS